METIALDKSLSVRDHPSGCQQPQSLKIPGDLRGDAVKRGQGIMAVVGYARVSTEDQSTEGQILDLKKFGRTEIFRENASGADCERSARHPHPPASGHNAVSGVPALFTCSTLHL
jgi:hypothetical protein